MDQKRVDLNTVILNKNTELRIRGPPFCGSIPQSSLPNNILIILVMIDEVNLGRMVMRPQGDLRGFSVAGNAEV